MRRIKKGNKVVVLVGKDKGREGVVSSVKGSKVVVEGVNLIKRHEKGNPNQNRAGGILQKEAPIDISNVALLNDATGKRDRVCFKVLEKGRKVRAFKSTGEVIDE